MSSDAALFFAIAIIVASFAGCTATETYVHAKYHVETKCVEQGKGETK